MRSPPNAIAVSRLKSLQENVPRGDVSANIVSEYHDSLKSINLPDKESLRVNIRETVPSLRLV